jgi:hypothetical protein
MAGSWVMAGSRAGAREVYGRGGRANPGLASIRRLLQLVDQHHVELQIRRLPLIQLLLGEVLLGVVGGLVVVSDVSGCGSDQFVDLVGVLELGTVDLRALGFGSGSSEYILILVVQISQIPLDRLSDQE